MKGLYKQRGSENYWVRFSINGRQYRFPTGEADEALAIEAARKIKANPPIAAAASLDAEIDALVADRSPNYRRDSLSVLKKFARAFEGVAVRDISAAKLQAWVNGLAVKPNTREAYRFQVQLLFDALVKAGKARTNPARDIEIANVEPNSARKNWVHRRDYPAIFDAATDLELRFALYAGLHAGLRYEEIIMMRPEWIDRNTGDHGVIHVMREPGVWKPKNKAERTIPLSPEFRNFLDNAYPRQPGRYMIAPHKVKDVKKGERYRVEFRNKFNAFVERHGFDFTRHDMRRSFASNLVSAGVSIYKVAKWIGDNVEVVERTYGHLDPRDGDVAEVFGPAPANVVPMPSSAVA